jgi:hypothetical protein
VTPLWSQRGDAHSAMSACPYSGLAMFGLLRRATPAVATVVTFLGVALAACRERPGTQEALAVVSAGAVDACASDSLRAAAAAPAEGLWLHEQPGSRIRVAARIGPPRSDDRRLVVVRPVETREVTATADTIRQRLDAATVSLELLPPLGSGTLGAVDTTAASHPAAAYAPSPRIRLAAYEPCVTSSTGPRTRYLRRDAAGRVVTDVMLRRASDR